MRIVPVPTNVNYLPVKSVIALLSVSVCMLFFDGTAFGQSAGDYRSAATGNWSSTATWETFNGTTWVAAVATPTSADGAITIRSGHTVAVTVAVTVDQVVVDSGGQVTVNSGIGWTVANGSGTDLTINGTVVNSGLTLFSAAGPTWVVNAGGTYVHNTTSGISTPLGGATLDAGSNFFYRGSSTLTPAVSVSSRTYGNLSFDSTSGNWTASVSGGGTLTINGDFSIGTGVTYSTAQSGTMTFAGNFTNNGTLTNGANTQTYTFTGSGKTIGGSGAISFETFNISLGASITLTQNLTVSTTLALNGDLTTGTFTTFMGNGSTSSGTGDVVGNVNRTDVGATTRSFGNPNVQITETAGTVSDMTVNLVKGSTPGDFLNSVQRVYTLTPNGGTLITATVQLHYLDSELNGNTESTLDLWRKDATLGWQNKGKDAVGGIDTTDNWVKLSGVTQFSPWTISGPSAPNYAKLLSFNATNHDGTVFIDWQTGLEVDNLGYNVYREQGGKRSRINSRMIAGSALLTGPGVSLMSGRSYAWSDPASGKQDVRYWLEEIDLNGVSTWHGPVGVEHDPPGDQLHPRDRQRALFLSDVGVENARQGQTARVEPSPKPATITAAALGTQSEFAERPAMKLAVNREGWYRVSAQELFAAGLDARTDPRMLQLFVEGQEQSFVVKGEEDGRLDPSDAIEFYGIGLDSAATDKRVYWLVVGSQPGKRVEAVRGKGSKAAPASFRYTAERRDRSIYFSSLRNGEGENFFGAVVSRQPVDQVITVRHLDKASAGDATIEVALRGVSLLPHRVKVELNGSDLGEVRFASQAEGVATFPLSQTTLKEGQNLVTLTAMATESDVSLVDYIRVAYPHKFTADDNSLSFSLSAKRQVTIDGFTSGSIRVLDITDADAVREISARIQGADGNYSVTVSAPKGGNRLLWAFADETAKLPLTITANRPSNLRDSGNAADLVIITHSDFKDSVKPLQELRQSQGMSVKVIDVQDVFDEFSFGQKSPQAIKEFLALARSSWKKSPRFALFVGDASFDPNNHLGRGDFDFVSTKLIDTKLMETASDDWFADSDGDGLAEMAIGRLPVRTAEEASRMISKIVSYDAAARPRDILLASDVNDGLDFQSEREQVRSLAPGDVSVQIIDRGQLGAEAARSQMLDSLTRGPWVVSYFGHGSVDLWRGNLFTSADAREMSNSGNLPVFFAITCLNGYFQDPTLDSLAESLMKSERGGAVAVWTSSGMCDAYPQAMLDQEMFRLILAPDGGSLMLGEAALKAKSSVADDDVRRTYILFGDPTTRLR